MTLQKTPNLLVNPLRKFASGISSAEQSPCDRLPRRPVQGAQRGRQRARVRPEAEGESLSCVTWSIRSSPSKKTPQR